MRINDELEEERREHRATIATAAQLRRDLEAADTRYHNEAKARCAAESRARELEATLAEVTAVACKGIDPSDILDELEAILSFPMGDEEGE